MEKGRVRFEGPGAGARRARRPRPRRLPRRRGRLTECSGSRSPSRRSSTASSSASSTRCSRPASCSSTARTGILNFAQGEIGAFGVALFALFHVQYDVPYWLAFALAVVATALIGMVIELTVVRRLFDSPRLVLLIATVGVAQLLLFLRHQPARTSTPAAAFPLPFTGQWRPTDSLVVLPREILVLIVAPVVIIALGAVHDPHDVRPRGARVGVERRHRARLRHQRQAHVDDRVDDRRRVRGDHRHPRRPAAGRDAGQHRRGRRRSRSARRCCCARSSSRSSPACSRCR